MDNQTPPMPVDAVLPKLKQALAANSRAILTAPPGSGKTTRVPLFLAGLWGDNAEQPSMAGTVLVLEPRRLATRSAARYMAKSLGEEVGGSVGFRVRLESKVSARTRVELITEGILTRRLLADPELQGVSCVIFDEFHERSLQADLGLALCLEAQQALRPDLRLLVMSATLDVATLQEFLSGARGDGLSDSNGSDDPDNSCRSKTSASRANCPLIHAEGKLWPVDIRYTPPPPAAFIGGRTDPAPLAADAVRRALAEESGSLLVFLPGTGEIRRTADLLTAKPLPHGVGIRPLYGDLSPADQDEAIAPCPPGQRKVVLSTSLAETSLTIEGVRVVVDAGLSRTSRFDPATDMDRLVTERVTQAGADQRAGRAGRMEPGVCYRLWDKGDVLRPHARPEILEADLAPLLLETLAWGTRPEDLPWLTLPPEAALTRARQTLTLLEALEIDSRGRERLTPHGEALARLPLHPRLGHMVLKAGDHASLAACLAAIVSERDPLRGASSSDIRLRLPCLRDKNQRLRRMAEQIHGLAASGCSFRLPGPAEEEHAGALLSLAWPDRVAQRRQRGSFRLASGKGAMLPLEDPLADAPFLAVASLDAGNPARPDTSKAAASSIFSGRVFLAAPLSREELESLHGHRIKRESEVIWDSREQAVVAVARVRLDALVLEERPLSLKADVAESTRQAVMEGIRSLGLACLPWTDDLLQWRARVAFLHALEPEQGWPDVSDAALLESLGDWLAPHLGGVSRRAHFGAIPLSQALRALLVWPLDRRLEQEAPCALEVPSGNVVRLDYLPEGGPVLAVKLQEMFGLAATPAIASGRAPLLIHLLSPAGRPLQVTRDLAGFWRSGYPAVRAEMRGRYPRHPWPDDPMSAVPTRRVKRKMG